ncbi:MAG: hypothetical protein A2496_17450 [Burkholderiales bacterium RIFOXYC12_FULL_60_6]|nr:MAG: hypothetical protein A2496_17450 [Burkholderiales bacterium RIFOXYC12_FULL_60_6]
MSDIEVKKMVKEDEKICVFATPNAKNITILEKYGVIDCNTNNYKVIQTLRSLESMALAQKNGFLILIKDVGIPHTFGDNKFEIYKKKETGELWWACDYRTSLFDKALEDNIFKDKEIDDPRSYMEENWEIIKNWFYSRRDQPFPIAAYAIPKDLTVGTRVFLSDVIEEVKYVYWNQGNAKRILSIAATWNGQDFEIDQPARPSCVG